MDLQVYLRVLYRFRVLVVGGVLLAALLALSSYVSVGSGGITYREHQQWEALSTVSIDSSTFILGRAVQPEVLRALQQANDPQAIEDSLRDQNPADFADIGYLTQLATIYQVLATSDGVLRRIRADGGGPIRGALQTFPVLAGGDAPVPMITFSSIASSPEAATSLAHRHLEAFKAFVQDRQNASDIPNDERVVVNVLKEPVSANLLEGRKKTRPILIFLTGLIAVIGLAFVLENLRPSGPGGTILRTEEDSAPVEVRRSRSA
jgi:capsular polysaccharide biosynthesis protein